MSSSTPATQSSGAAQPNQQPKPKRKWHTTAWLYKEVDRRRCLRTITPTLLEPSGQPVTSGGEVAVLGTFCWTPEREVRVPSREPIFQHVALPAVLPPVGKPRGMIPSGRAMRRPQRGNKAGGVNSKLKASETGKPEPATATAAAAAADANAMPPHSLAPLAQAIATMSPSHRLRGTDLVVQRNSLRKLFALCGGQNPDSFRVGLQLVRDKTLVVTKQDMLTWHPSATRASGVGLSFERLFTRAAEPGREGDQSHHRVISYDLGGLRCVVQFEVDACYYAGGEGKMATGSEADDAARGGLTIEEKLLALSLEPPTLADTTPPPTTAATAAAPVVLDSAGAAPQSTVAEMKTCNAGKRQSRLSGALPQLWFGRTPWFIQGRREGNAVTVVDVTDVTRRFADWEERHQETLRRLVTLVRELRDSVRAAGPGCKHCVLVYDRAEQDERVDGEPQQRVVRIYRANVPKAKEPIPRDLVERLWGPD
ncbi:hypothetical protein RB601_008654 [Gaeumannomyces tritici]